MSGLNLAAIETELRAVFPALSIPSPLSVIGSGFNSIVVEAGQSLIFRIGKNSIAQEGYEKEIKCLPIFAPRLPFLIPIPKWHVKRSTFFPFGMIGYDKIAGILLQPHLLNRTNLSLVARDTARFLCALHQLRPDSPQPMRPIDQTSKWQDQYQKVLPILKSELTVAEFNQIKQWWDHFLTDRKMPAYNPVIQHGDLWYENMIVNASIDKLVGIIDWEKISIGDPAQDFATLFHSGEEFVRLVLQTYEALGGELDEHFEYRMQRLWEAREFDGLNHAIEFDDLIELQDALHKLRQGPILGNIP